VNWYCLLASLTWGEWEATAAH